MAAKRTPGSRPGLIHCEHCGEEYSESYRRCPFCDEYDEYENETSSRSRSGGKRVAQSRRRGGGYSKVSVLSIIIYILSLAIIAVAAWIVITVVVPLIQRGDLPGTPVDPDSSQSEPAAPDTSPEVSPDVSPEVSPDADPGVSPEVSPSPDITEEPTSTPSTAPGSANGFNLSKTDISFAAAYPDPVVLKVTFTPAGTSGTITWSSSNTNYATVDQNGKVSPGPQKGTATITATLDNGVKQTCIVRNNLGSSSGSSSTTTTPSQSTDNTTYKINKSDFTFYRVGETTKLKAVDYTGTVTWKSSNTNVVTVDSDGTCTAVGSGSCTITGTLANGTTVKAIARVSLS